MNQTPVRPAENVRPARVGCSAVLAASPNHQLSATVTVDVPKPRHGLAEVSRVRTRRRECVEAVTSVSTVHPCMQSEQGSDDHVTKAIAVDVARSGNRWGVRSRGL